MVDTKSPEELQKGAEALKEWVKSQPHLPKDLDDKLIKRFLHTCYYDMDLAKNTIDVFTGIRASSPELFTNRDPLAPHMQKILKIVNLAHLHISGNRNLWIWQLNDPGLENYDYLQDARIFFLSTDSWLLETDVLQESDIAILDVKDITLKFITKFNMSVAKKLSKYQEEAMPIRLKQVHIVNAPSFIDKIFSLIKPFMNKDMTSMIHFHPPKSESLYQYISKEDLPVDFGGTLPSMNEQMKSVTEIIYSKREYLKNDNLWKAADKKSKNKAESSTEIGSFRTLAID